MGQGRVMMEEIYEENHYDQQYRVMARAQDETGWWQFYGGDDLQRDRADSEDAHRATSITTQRREMGSGPGHQAAGGDTWPMALPQHPGSPSQCCQ